MLSYRSSRIYAKDRSAFTLIELLVVIGIIAILAVVVVLTLNPIELLRQSRDSTRLSDIQTLTSAINLSISQGASVSGTPYTLYLSLSDPNATTTAGTNCAGLGFVGNFHCSESSTIHNVDGTGWLPVNFNSGALGLQPAISELPVDPENASSGNFYYAYETDGTNWEIAAAPESSKYSSVQSAAFVGGNTRILFPTDGLSGSYSFSPATYPLSSDPSEFMAFDSHTNTVWMPNVLSNTVTVANDTTYATSTYATGSSPSGVAFDPHTNTVWVSNNTASNVTVFNDTTYATSTYATASNPTGIAFDPNTNTVWVTTVGGNAVTVFNDTTYATSTYAVGVHPYGVAFDPHTNTVWVANYAGSTITVFNDATYATSTYALGAPQGIISDPHTVTVWAATNNGNGYFIVFTPSR